MAYSRKFIRHILTAIQTGQRYPSNAFTRFLRQLDPDDIALLTTLFSLLSSATSYSLKNGMTPSRLARLFGPLLFGLPEDETFQRTYDAYVRASNATEHLLLAYIREQSTKESLPTRLVEHVKGYPRMLSPDITRLEQHARSTPVTVIETITRGYHPDLLQSACQLNLAVHCEEWEACRGDDERHGIHPQFSDKFRKLVNYRGGIQGLKPRGSPLSPSLFDPRSPEAELELHGSLASKEWGDFANGGFLETDSTKLAFDLKETERRNLAERKSGKVWKDFAQTGFGGDQDDEGLDSVLGFDEQLQTELAQWPSNRAEILEKMRKTAKRLPDFSYDTRAKVLNSPSLCTQANPEDHSHIDETFAEAWADYLLGCGWSNRDELSHRAASFIVVQYKSRPTAWSVSSLSNSVGAHLPTSIGSDAEEEARDPRTDAAWFIISEVVPAPYRAALEALGRKKASSKTMLRKLNIFKSISKPKAASEKSPIYDPNDVFRPGAGGHTKQIRLNDPVHPTLESDRSTYATFSQSGSPVEDAFSVNGASVTYSMSQRPTRNTHSPRQRHFASDADFSVPELPKDKSGSSGFMNALRSRSQRMRQRKPVPGLLAPPLPPPKSGTPSDYATLGHDSSVDFETRSLYEGDSPKKGDSTRHAHRQSRDDAWIDVMLKREVSGASDAVPPMRRSSIRNSSASPRLRAKELSDPALQEPALASTRAQVSNAIPAASTVPAARIIPGPAATKASAPAPALPDFASAEPTRRALLPTMEIARPLSDVSEGPQVAYLRDETQELPPAPVPVSSAAAVPGEDRPDPAVLRSKLRPAPLQAHKTGGSIDMGVPSPAAVLRASLVPVDTKAKAAPLPVEKVADPVSPNSRENPFDKSRTQGRVAKIAGQFGGPLGKQAEEKERSRSSDSGFADTSAELATPPGTQDGPAPASWAKDEQDTHTDLEQSEANDLAMPMSNREPYQVSNTNRAKVRTPLTPFFFSLQPGQPLHSLMEADETSSIYSGSTNSRRR